MADYDMTGVNITNLALLNGAAVGGGGGAWTYLSTITASASTVDFTSDFSSTYDDYMVVINDWNGAYTGHSFYCQVRAAGTWITTATYNWNLYYMTVGSATVAVQYGINNPFMNLTAGTVSSTSSDGTSLVVHLPNVNGSSKKTIWSHAGFSPYNNKTTAFMAGQIDTTSVIDGVRLTLSNGTMTGTFKLYGLAKS